MLFYPEDGIDRPGKSCGFLYFMFIVPVQQELQFDLNL